MTMSLNQQATIDWEYQSNAKYAYFALIFLVAIMVRLIGLPDKWLWYDELHSVTYSYLPLQDLIKNVYAFDSHPPLYYLQLHFWMLFGVSDWWIKLNSVLWSSLTLVMIFLLSNDLFDVQISLLGTLIFAISPFAVAYAQEARMYAFLMFWGTGSFYCFQRYVNKQNQFYRAVELKLENLLAQELKSLALIKSRASIPAHLRLDEIFRANYLRQTPGFKQSGIYLLGAIVCTEVFLYSHGAGFLLLVSLSAYAVEVLWENGFRRWRVFLKLGGALLLIFALYIPWLFRAYAISVNHALQPDLHQVINTLFILIGGYIPSPEWLKWSIVILFIIGSLLCASYNPHIRTIVVTFVIMPILFCIFVSYVSRPIWLYRTLAYAAPFWSIVIAYILFQAGKLLGQKMRLPWVGYTLASLMLYLFVYATALQQASFIYPWQFHDAARFLQSSAQKGDVVYAPVEGVFWGIAWYLVGPGSVNPLTTTHSLLSSRGVKVISKRALIATTDREDQLEIPPGNYWLVYRTLDEIAPFKEETPQMAAWDFGGMKIVQVEVTTQ